MEEYGWLFLVAGGFVAGAINTLAGGGSLLTVPLLISFGLPPVVANGTNRLGVLASSVTSSWGFHKEGLSGLRAARPILLPLIVGSLVGATAISQVSNHAFEKLFALLMLALLFPLLRRPTRLSARPPDVQPWSRATTTLVFFAIGLYGGSLQAGIGIFLIFALTYSGYDLVRANSIKVLVTAAVSLFAIPVFLAQDQIDWAAGLTLAIGFAAGGVVGARWTVRGGEALIRPLLALAVVGIAGHMLGFY